MATNDQRYKVHFSKGETEYVEATKLDIEGGWITLYNEHQPVMTVSCGAVERIEHPVKDAPEPFMARGF